MTTLGPWTYSGAIPLTNDLSLLESDLHAGRVAAAENGYDGDPDSIDIEEAMLTGTDSSVPEHLVSAAEAEIAGHEFVPTHTRFIMRWDARA